MQERCKIDFAISNQEQSSLIQQLYLSLFSVIVADGLRSAGNGELKYHSLIILGDQLEGDSIQQAI